MNNNYIFWFFFQIISLVPMYFIGRKLVKLPFITTSLVGLSAIAFLMGILANISAGCIKISILLIYLYGFIEFGLYFYRHKFSIKIKHTNILLITLIILIVFLINNPYWFFISTDSNMISMVSYNKHYSYYEGLSTEILRAEYFSRLRIANNYPNEWINYHFFNASALSFVQYLRFEYNLITYFMAKIFIFSLMIFSFFENIFLYKKEDSKIVLSIITLFWLFIGFSFFGHNVTWNITTTGLFSFFAIPCFIFAFIRKDYYSSIIFLMILGASAFRLMPIAFISCIFILYFFTGKNIRQYFKDNLIFKVFFILLFLIYNLLTLIPNRGSFIKISGIVQNPFIDGWLFNLSFYKIIGYILSFFNLDSFFKYYNFVGYFSNNNSILFISFFVLIFSLLLCMLGFLFKNFKLSEFKLLNKTFLFFFLLIFMIFSFKNKDYLLFNMLCLTYIFVTSIICAILVTKNKEYINLLNFSFFIQFFSAICCYLGTNEIFGTTLYVTFDLLIWSILLILLIEFNFSRVKYLIIPIIVICIYFPQRFYASIYFTKFETTELNIGNLRQIKYANKGKEFFQLSTQFSSQYIDIVSSILGMRVQNNEKYIFATNDFIDRKKTFEKGLGDKK
nr:hypothetical protein GTC16762_07900 [Pigmentibacter ruber]